MKHLHNDDICNVNENLRRSFCRARIYAQSKPIGGRDCEERINRMKARGPMQCELDVHTSFNDEPPECFLQFGCGCTNQNFNVISEKLWPC